MKRNLSWIPGLALLSGCALMGGGEKPFDLNAPISEQANHYVTTDGVDKLPSKRVAITSFGVEFQTKVVHVAKAFGSASTSSTILTLEGVTPETMQAITDEAYASLAKDLQAAGYEVVPFETIKQNASYQDLAGYGQPSPVTISFHDPESFGFQNSEAQVYAPTGMVYYPPDLAEAGARLNTLGKTFSDAFSGVGRGLSGKQPRPKVEVALADALDATLIKAYYVVAFGKAGSTAASFDSSTLHGSKSSAGIAVIGGGETRLSLRTPNASTMHFQWGKNPPPVDGNAFVRLDKGVNAGLPFLANDLYNSTTTSQAVGNAISQVGAVVAGLSGVAGSTANTQQFTAPADDSLYRTNVAKQIGAVEGMLVHRLKAGK